MTLEIIQHPDSTFQELIDFKRDMRDENYHPSSFVISKEVPEGLLLFHTLTCEMVLAGKGREDISSDEYLREHLFVVPKSLEQIEISTFYEKMPKPTLIATEEFIEGKVFYRNPSKDVDSLI